MDIGTLVQIALAGVSAVRNEAESTLVVTAKQTGELVTQADAASNDAIMSVAAELLPGIPVHSEESHWDNWTLEERVLIIDPLDGTTNLLHALPFSSVSIAYVEHAVPKAGVVAPIDGGIYYAIQGRGSYFARSAEAWKDSNPIHCAAQSLKESIVNVTADQSDEQSRQVWYEWLRALRPPVCYRLRIIESAALELCWLACGKIDAYLHPTDKVWDVAAGGLIARESGARVYTPSLENWDLRQEGIVAASPAVASRIIKILRSLNR
jgi:myo-inositol-1(or 4)-monophosphatase